MKLTVVAVGRASRLLETAIAEYERRAGRYWRLEVSEVKEERLRRQADPAQVMAAEAERIGQRIPAGAEAIALTRSGRSWSSVDLADHLGDLALHGRAGAAFMIGGSFGLDEGLVREADMRLSLSAMTLPHDIARLLLLEQLYRAGTIRRGEPYHKGED